MTTNQIKPGDKIVTCGGCDHWESGLCCAPTPPWVRTDINLGECLAGDEQAEACYIYTPSQGGLMSTPRDQGLTTTIDDGPTTGQKRTRL